MTTLPQGLYFVNSTGVKIEELEHGFQECLGFQLLQPVVMYTVIQEALPSRSTVGLGEGYHIIGDGETQCGHAASHDLV